MRNEGTTDVHIFALSFLENSMKKKIKIEVMNTIHTHCSYAYISLICVCLEAMTRNEELNRASKNGEYIKEAAGRGYWRTGYFAPLIFRN